MNLDIFVVDALDRFSCGMLCFNDSEECYWCTIINLLSSIHLIFLARTMINVAHFDIMADTAGYSVVERFIVRFE